MNQEQVEQTALAVVHEGAFAGDRFVTAHGASNPGVAVWRLPAGAGQGPARWIPLAELAGGPRAVALSPAGDRVLVAAREGGAMRVLDAESGAALAALEGPSASVAALAWSPDGAWVAAAGQHQAEPPPEPASESAGESAGDPAKAVAYVSGGLVLAWRSDALDGKPVSLPGPGAAVADVAFAPDSARVTAIHEDGAVISWDLASAREVARVALPGRGHALAYGPGGELAVARTVPGQSGLLVTLLDVGGDGALRPRGKELAAGSSWPADLAWSGDGARLAVTAVDAVYVLEVASGRQQARLDYGSRAHGPDPRAAAFTDGGVLVLGGEKQAWLRWELGRRARVSARP